MVNLMIIKKNLIDKKISLKRISLFFIIGCFVTLTYYSIMSFCIEIFSIAVFWSSFFAFVGGTIISYIGNTLFTFKQKMRKNTAYKFLIITLIGLLLNQTIALILNWFNLHYFYIIITVFIIIPIFNYIGHTIYTYKDEF